MIVETRSYMNEYTGLNVVKVTSTAIFKSWFDAMRWVGNYIDEYDHLLREAHRDGRKIGIKVCRIRRESFLYDTILVVHYENGIDAIHIKMAW